MGSSLQVSDVKNIFISIANATADLLLLSAWSMVTEIVDGKPIPVSIPSAVFDTQHSQCLVLLLRTG